MDRYIEFALNHYILVLALIVVTYLLIQEFFDSAFKKFASISPMVAVTKMNEGNTTVVDVREHDEYNKGHIEEAVNIPLSLIKEHINHLDAYKNTRLLVVCQDGSRSASAGKIIAKTGFKDVMVMAGGMQSWQEDYKYPIKVNRKKN